jgi:hypothetical protein
MLLHMRMIVTITQKWNSQEHRVANTFFGPHSMGMACKSKVFHKPPQNRVGRDCIRKWNSMKHRLVKTARESA